MFHHAWDPKAPNHFVVGSMRKPHQVDIFRTDLASDLAGGSPSIASSASPSAPPDASSGAKTKKSDAAGKTKGKGKGTAGKAKKGSGAPKATKAPKAPKGGSAEGGGKVTQVARLQDEFVRSHQSRHVVHPLLNVIVSANSSGRCHVWRGV